MGATFRTRHLVDTEEHLQHLAAISLGVALVPERIPIMPPLEGRRLTGVNLVRSVALAVVNGRRFSPALDLFVKIARARNFGPENSVL
jgi:hypothetical protein